MEEYEKICEEFINWNKVKLRLELYGRKPNFSEGELWWAGIGRNIGSEMNGKNKGFARPVLIFKKQSREIFMAIPLTSKSHSGSWYVPFLQKGKYQEAIVGHARVMSFKRLYSKIGQIDGDDFTRIRAVFLRLYSK